MGLALEIQALRLRRGLSLEDLSNALNENYGTQVSVESLKRYERDDNACLSMSTSKLIALAKFYDISIDYLLGLSNYSNQDIARLSVCGLGISETAVELMRGRGTIVPSLNLLARYDAFPNLLSALSKYYFACEADAAVKSEKEAYAIRNGNFPNNSQLAEAISGMKTDGKYDDQTICFLWTLEERYKRAADVSVFLEDDADNIFLNKLQMHDIYDLQSAKYLHQLLSEMEEKAVSNVSLVQWLSRMD